MKLTSDYSSRIDAQREVLMAVNKMKLDEPLLGLYGKSIKRWVRANDLRFTDDLVDLVFEIAQGLYFLATKSQDPVDQRNRQISAAIVGKIAMLDLLVDQWIEGKVEL